MDRRLPSRSFVSAARRPTALGVAIITCCALVAAQAARAQTGLLVVEGLNKPVDFVADPTDAGRFYIVEQGGVVRRVEGGVVADRPFFEVDRSNFNDRGWEQGLLGMAFDPAYADNRRFYLNYSGRDGSTHVSRFTATDHESAAADTEEIILRIDQPWENHNGGCIRFGPDGMLYVGMGDGGAANDPLGSGQDLSSLLGKMLRIDVAGEPDPGLAYRVPPDNPFVGRDGARPEIWAYGVRNPWRFSFDSRGRMWIADVGQNRWEWVHLQPEGSKGGENYGWNAFEGHEAFQARPRDQRGRDPGPVVAPVWSYSQRSNGGSGSITGGFFYEGDAIPALKNRYLCADFMSGRVWSFKLGRDGKADDIVEHTRALEPAFGEAGLALSVSSFGQDLAGELYLVIHRPDGDGRIVKIVP